MKKTKLTKTTISMNYEKPFIAGNLTTIKFLVIIGQDGIKKGGCIKIGTPNMGWGQPFCSTPRDWSELLEGKSFIHNSWKPINTTYKLKSRLKSDIQLRGDENQITDVTFSKITQDAEFVEIDRSKKFKFKNPPMKESFIDKYGQWRWWITATVVKENLVEGDVIEIVYGDTGNSNGIKIQPWFEDKLDFCALADFSHTSKFIELSGSPINIKVEKNIGSQIHAVIPTIIHPTENQKIKLSILDKNFLPPKNNFTGSINFYSKTNIQIDSNKIVKNILVSKIKTNYNDIHRIEVTANNFDKIITNPGVSSEDNDLNIYWGDLHAQSKYHQWKIEINRGDSCNSPKGLHEYARDYSLLDFVTITDGFGAYDYNPGWQETQKVVNEMYQPGKYEH